MHILGRGSPGCAWMCLEMGCKIFVYLPKINNYLNHTICRTGTNIKMSTEYQTNIQMAAGGVQMCLDVPGYG